MNSAFADVGFKIGVGNELDCRIRAGQSSTTSLLFRRMRKSEKISYP